MLLKLIIKYLCSNKYLKIIVFKVLFFTIIIQYNISYIIFNAFSFKEFSSKRNMHNKLVMKL